MGDNGGERDAGGEDAAIVSSIIALGRTLQMRIVAEGVNALRGPERSMLVITHYQRLLDYIKPDKVHVLARGRIVASGGPELARQLETEGYEAIAA